MKSVRFKAGICLAVAVAILAVAAVYLLAAGRAGDDIHAAGARQLQIIALDLESVLERYETLPFTLGVHPDVVRVLLRPDENRTVQRLNQLFSQIQRHAKVSAIYLMDKEGNTLAASNWNEPLTFVGRNFAFRPYFREALAGKAGRFYGIGNATGEPGYFIAHPVYAEALHQPAEPIGVIAVKIGLAEFEQTWRSSEDPITLVDRNGVVFLSNRPEWRYHSMKPLDRQAQQRLADTLQYAARTIQPIALLPKKVQAGFGDHVAQPVSRLGWQLMLFPSQARINRSALLSAIAAALVLSVGAISAWAVHQRRRRLEERIESRKALQRAAEELDRKIVQRTQELLQANLDLASRYAKLQEAEHLLRSTQNELVQAGKLAMLGQMAAGVTHELNQPLAAIRAFADNAITFLARGQAAKAEENLGQISAASARMGAIIGQLKGFARKSHDAVATVDLARSVQASAMLLDSEFRRHGVRLDIEILHHAAVLGDAVRTEQVLINLLRNALDAVEQASERRVAVSIDCDGEEALVRIRDSGPGIPEDVVRHLFEPFFTTKPSGKGLGLGLAISSSIVQAMNGQLSARNLSEGGAEFTVRLPLAADIPNEIGGQVASA
ncbi:sensor histidine kinase [Noviherbaspirillum saxi]|uniref:C4-dicarboxylate transport sensor protein DctB n=1 Tax=Noviherbaspirillum saxi TaxID=2320863 RepID=A0A3A3FZ03_9BURK|nr:ATP-binding protein [Noviherbaspirillum saxi]RJF99928.1 sensor histidine kinase [Noviherbaspirillum saxi]